MVFNTVMAAAQLALLPTARNSNLLPVKANGLVRLRSVLSSITEGMRPISSFNSVLLAGDMAPLMFFSNPSKRLVRYSPMNTLMMAGGASLAPRRWSLFAVAMLARSTSAWLWMALMVLTKKARNWMFSLGVLAGRSRFLPVLVARLQLLCLPLPFTPA